VAGLASAVCARIAGARWSPDLLTRSTAPVGHMRPDLGAFAVPAGVSTTVRGRRALLLDDTYVSGARAQSAAAALRRAGACSVVIVAVGRVLRPDRSAAHATFLDAARVLHSRSDPASMTMPVPCCRCIQTGAGTE
jgi:hypothetical protein